MATAFTNADALCIYHAGLESDTAIYTPDSSIGGIRLSKEVDDAGYQVSNPIPQLIIDRVLPSNGTGTATIKVKSTTTISYTAPGDTEGATVTINDGDSLALESGTVSKAIRVTRSGSDDLQAPGPGVNMTLNLQYPFNNAIGMSNVTNAQRVAGVSTYRGLILRNESALPITSLTLYPKPLIATTQVSDTAQLGAAGAGTIGTSGSFAEWPAAGFAYCYKSGGNNETVYYTSRTATVLTVPAAGRGLLGSTATAGTATDAIYCVPGIALGTEALGSDGSIQRIANENTAPAAVTFQWRADGAGGTTSPGTLAAGASIGLWIKRQLPANAVLDIGARNSIYISYTYNGVGYVEQLDGLYRVADTTIEGYELYAGVDADPDLTAAPDATSATLPFTYALTPPGAGNREYRYTVLYRNRYNITSLNQYWRTVTISSTGANVTPSITPPSGIAMVDAAGGYVTLAATYNSLLDASPADTWAVYATTTGVDPDPATDTPQLTAMAPAMNGGGFTSSNYSIARTAAATQGPYAWGADLRILVRARRSSDSAESVNTTAVTLTVGTTSPIRINRRSLFLNTTNAQALSNAALSSIYYVDTPNAVRFIVLNGETIFYGGTTEIWRITCPDANRGGLFIPNAWALVNDSTAWGAGTATAYNIEVNSWTAGNKLLYVIVNGTRRCKIDVTNQTISADTFYFYGTLTDCPVDLPTVGVSAETLFQVWNETLGRFVAGVSVSSAGVFTTAQAVIQERGN